MLPGGGGLILCAFTTVCCKAPRSLLLSARWGEREKLSIITTGPVQDSNVISEASLSFGTFKWGGGMGESEITPPYIVQTATLARP